MEVDAVKTNSIPEWEVVFGHYDAFIVSGKNEDKAVENALAEHTEVYGYIAVDKSLITARRL